METAGAPQTLGESTKPARLSFEQVIEVLWDCAWESLILAFSIYLLGGIVVDIVGPIFQEMTPSLPPIVAEEPTTNAHRNGSPAFNFVHRHWFLLMWGVVFVGLSAGRLVQLGRKADQNRALAWGRRLASRISREWFGIVVVNAFAASIGVIILQFVQAFSMTHILWQALMDVLRPAVQWAANLVPGEHSYEGFKSWAAWYNANSFKFTFWVLYTAAICDDLGLPNYKTLGKLCWERARSKRKKSAASPATKVG